ncbi:MAG: accessory gene regulator B family protein [Acetatifactor sp.]
MVQKIVDALVNKQSQNYVMTDEDEKIYRYGYVLLCEVFLNLVIALAIGIVFSKTKEVIFFLGMYIPLRSFCGGWHADKIWKCTVISNAILLLQVYGIENIIIYLSIRDMLVIFFLNMVCVYFISPVDTEMKKISQDERKTYKRKIKFILVFHVIIAIITVLFDADEFVFSLMFVYIIQNVMLLIEIKKHRKCYFRRNGKLEKAEK